MGARGESAAGAFPQHFREVAGNLLLLHIYQPKAPNPRRINDIAPGSQRIHLVQRRGMLPLQVCGGNSSNLGIQRRVQRLDEGRFPHAGLSGKQVHLPLAGLANGIDPLPAYHGSFDDRIAGSLVNGMEAGEPLRIQLPVHVHFGQDDGSGNTVERTSDQDAVQERQLHLREIERHHQVGPVHVGGNDVRLAGQVGGTADNIVPARENLRDNGGRFRVEPGVAGVHFIPDHISHGDGIGDHTLLQADFPPQHGREHLPRGQFRQQIMAAGILNNGCFSCFHRTNLQFLFIRRNICAVRRKSRGVCTVRFGQILYICPANEH